MLNVMKSDEMGMTEVEMIQVAVLENGKAGGVIAGPEHIITEICRRFGFKHSGRRVFLTAPKMAMLGLANEESVCPNWRSLSSEQLSAVGWGR